MANVKLSALIMSEVISDKTIIRIYDSDGSFLAKGNWFQDQILNYSDRFGQATKPGTGLSINFRLV